MSGSFAVGKSESDYLRASALTVEVLYLHSVARRSYLALFSEPQKCLQAPPLSLGLPKAALPKFDGAIQRRTTERRELNEDIAIFDRLI